MSHREQHYAGLHYAKITEIGVKYDNPNDNPYSEDSPNSPSLDQVQKLHDRVFKKNPRSFFDTSTLHGLIQFYAAADAAADDLLTAQKYGFTYFKCQNCNKCNEMMIKSTATYRTFSFPVWLCENCGCYYTANFDGIEDYTVNGLPLKPQKMMVIEGTHIIDNK